MHLLALHLLATGQLSIKDICLYLKNAGILCFYLDIHNIYEL